MRVTFNNEGYFHELDPNSVIEAITGNYISRKNAIRLKRYSGWVLKENIANINGDYYSKHDKAIINSKLDGYILKEKSVNEALTNSIIDKTKAVFSSKYNKYVHKSNVVYVNNGIYHKQDKDIRVLNNKWYHISQCFVNYDRRQRNAYG